MCVRVCVCVCVCAHALMICTCWMHHNSSNHSVTMTTPVMASHANELVCVMFIHVEKPSEINRTKELSCKPQTQVVF